MILTTETKNIVDTISVSKAELTEIYTSRDDDFGRNGIRFMNTHEPRYRHDIQKVQSHLREGAKILDMGAAPFLTAHSLHHLGFDVVAGDIHPNNWLDIERLPYKVEQFNCDGIALPFEDQVFDCVIMTEVFEHLHMNLNFTMKEVLRIIKTGGFLYLTTPNLLAIRSIVRMIRKGKLPGNVYTAWQGAELGDQLGHVREYAAREIRDHLEACGYQDVDVTTVNVYRKNALENIFWRSISAPFRNGRETISAIAYRR